MEISGKSILFVGAHPDDVEITAGGTISKLVRLGNKVTIAICSLPNTDDEYHIRKTEAIKGAISLGIDLNNLIFIKGHDTQLHLSLDKLIKEINYIIVERKIDIVFTHFEFDTHQDHRTTSQAVLAAARNVPTLIFTFPVYPSGRTTIPFIPNLAVELTENDIANKISALSEHKSQIEKYGTEDWLDVMTHTAKSNSWNTMGKHGYAELFMINRIKL